MSDKGSKSNSNNGQRASDYSITKSWGEMHNFMNSYGVKTDPEGYQKKPADENQAP